MRARLSEAVHQRIRQDISDGYALGTTGREKDGDLNGDRNDDEETY